MLSPIQIEIATIINTVNGRDKFVLAGGAALIYKNISNRETEDLDYITRERAFVNTFARSCKQAIENESYTVNIDIENEGFCKFTVYQHDKETSVDFGHDYFTSTDDSNFGPTLSTIGLGANKVLALSGRSKSRDGFDLYSLCKVNDISIFVDRAPEIDPGFTVDQLIRGLQGLRRFSVQDSGFSEEEWTAVLEWSEKLIVKLESH